jgi:hypothetical protein
MNKFFEACRAVTNKYRAGKGLEPIAEPNDVAATHSKPIVELPSGGDAPAAAPLGDGVEGAAVTPIEPDSELYRRLATPEEHVAPPKIWEHSGNRVFKHGLVFATCSNTEDAWFIADRLNAFDANLCERNLFQQLYLAATKAVEGKS